MKNFYRILSTAAIAVSLQACDSNDSPTAITPPPTPVAPAPISFDVTVQNLTNAQPLSPVAVVAHGSGYSVFSVGMPASVEFEELAEGGDNMALVASANADTTNVFATGSGGAPIGPAGSETVTIASTVDNLAALQISVATMLVNTNDAISVLNGFDASNMSVGDSMVFNAIAYDAGTEADTEAAADIPGPAGGGEGFNAARSDDADRVAMHPGIVSQDDGLATSDLTEQHRFDNPVMRVRIARTQ